MTVQKYVGSTKKVPDWDHANPAKTNTKIHKRRKIWRKERYGTVSTVQLGRRELNQTHEKKKEK